MKNKCAFVLIISVLALLSACCCTDLGMDPPQPHQYERVTPPVSEIGQ